MPSQNHNIANQWNGFGETGHEILILENILSINILQDCKMYMAAKMFVIFKDYIWSKS